jgi:hypothetical protein
MPTPVIPERPRAEHPRPDLHRGLEEGRDWVCLNGWWDFDFDPGNVGRKGQWHRPRHRLSRRIRVPFPWQSHAAWGTEAEGSNTSWFSPEAHLEPGAASVADASYRDGPQQETGWYRRSFTFPAAWRQAGKRVFLHVGAADFHLTAWVNGKKVGEDESGYLPLRFDVTDALKARENVLVLRVHDPMDHRAQPVGKQYAWYTRTSGVWQSVWLEPRAPAHITGLRVYPDAAAGLARVRLRISAPEAAARARLRVQISLAGQQLASSGLTLGDLEPGDHDVEIAAHVPVVRRWSPEEPLLYDLAATLHYNRPDGPEQRDEVNTYFGFRDVTVAPLYNGGPAYICLSGRPVYLRGNLNQSLNPWGVYTFASDDDIRRDMQQALEGGWNFVRLHIKLEDPRWYYWADRLGLLIMQDMPNFGYDGYCEDARARWERTLRGALDRDANHPCIVAWCLFNETWGLGGDDYKRLPDRHAWVEAMYHLARQLDPTRPVEDMSPCLYDHVITDINSWHFYINDYEVAAAHIREVVDQTHPGSALNYVPGRFQRGEPLMNSEYGGISAGSGDMDVSWCFRFLTNELRLHEKICGYIYTEQMDIEWEHNGFYNYDRTPKQFGYNPALLQREQYVGITGPAGREVAGERAALQWWLRGPAPASAARLVARAQRLNALAEMDGEWRETVAVGDWDMARLGHHDLPLPAELTSRPGLVWVWLELLDEDSRVLAGNFAVLEVTGPAEVPQGGQLLDLAAATGRWSGPVERAEVGADGVQLLSGEGSGTFRFPLKPPAGAVGLTILAELSSRRPGPGVPQTDADAWPTGVTLRLGDAEVARLPIGNQYADARGALSHMHGLAGRYGEPVRVEVGAEVLAAAVGGGGRLNLAFAVEAADATCGGLTIYGPRAGRYPCGLTVLWHMPATPGAADADGS